MERGIKRGGETMQNPYPGAPPLLRDYLTYIETVKGHSRATVDEYGVDLNLFLRYLKCRQSNFPLADIDNAEISDMGAAQLSAVTQSIIYEYMYYLSRERGNGVSARARKLSSLKGFYKYLTAKSGILKENPVKDIDSPKKDERLPRYLTLDESIALLNSVEGEFKTRNYAIITLFLNCGLRLSELTGINIADYKGDKVTVFGKGGRERVIYLNNACRKALDGYLEVRPRAKDKNALFISKRGTRLTNKMVQVIVKDALARAGLDTQKYSAHKLRHTAATLMYKHGGVDVLALKEILGHRQLSTTQIYTHVDDERLKKAAEQSPLANIESEPPAQSSSSSETSPKSPNSTDKR